MNENTQALNRLLNELFDEVITMTENCQVERRKARLEKDADTVFEKFGEEEGLRNVLDLLLKKKNEILGVKGKTVS